MINEAAKKRVSLPELTPLLLTISGQVPALSWPGRLILGWSPGTTSWSFRSPKKRSSGPGEIVDFC